MQHDFRWFKRCLLFAVLVGVAACGKSGNVVTKDDSAEYRSAKSLPPLKKPDRSDVLINSSTPVETNSQAQSTVVAQKPTSTSATTAVVVDAGNGEVELEINAPADKAWQFVRRNIGKSNLTVHTRNKSAGRFSIGCSSLEPEAPEAATKKGGWSIFKRSREKGDHCALQLNSAKNVTRVQVLGRNGEPVAADSAREIFARLLNN